MSVRFVELCTQIPVRHRLAAQHLHLTRSSFHFEIYRKNRGVFFFHANSREFTISFGKLGMVPPPVRTTYQ